MSIQIESTQVIIIGAGPTGALLSAYLGRYGVNNIVLEKNTRITTDPRGITLDAEGLRCLQGVGAIDGFWRGVGCEFGKVNFISGDPEKNGGLHATPVFSFDSDVVGPLGHPYMVSQSQPALEKLLHDKVSEYQCCELKKGCKVVGITEENESVFVKYRDITGEERLLKGSFLVGADGRSGFTRKMYLEERGVVMEAHSKFPYEETWVAMNLQITPPTLEDYPEFQLLKQGLSPEETYEAFFPPAFHFLCNPKRASVFGRVGPREDRLVRFEFVVNENESASVLEREEVALSILSPHLAIDGKKYGVDGKIMFPENCIQILRSRSYKFSAKSCNKWAVGRVMICGDAAHVFPPFGGQGISSGFRDAVSLAWRLAVLTAPSAPSFQGVLEAWYQERKQQLKQSLGITKKIAAFCTETNPTKIIIRDWVMWFLQLFPGLKNKMAKEARGRPLMRYRWNSNFPFIEDLRGGKMFPQAFCIAIEGTRGEEKPILTDSVIFSVEKTGLFRLVIFLNSSTDIEKSIEELKLADLRFQREIRFEEAVIIFETVNPENAGKNVWDIDTFRLCSREVSKDRQLSVPASTDGYEMWKDIVGKYIILRPDRYVFADCKNVHELGLAMEGLGRLLEGDNTKAYGLA